MVMMIVVGMAANAEANACVTPWRDTLITNVTVKMDARLMQGQAQGQKQKQGQAQGQSQTNELNGIGNPVMEAVPDFPQPYVPIPAAPLPYSGPYPDKSQFADDQPEFQQVKWMSDEIDNLPNGGKVIPVIRHKVTPVKYIQPRTRMDYDVARRKLNDYIMASLTEKEGMTAGPLKGLVWHGNVYCNSRTSDDNPGTVWGGCAKTLRDKGCTFAYKIAGLVIYGARSNATNQSGGLSFAGIFGQLFGFNAGAGASNTDHEAVPYESIRQTWACFGEWPIEKKAGESRKGE